MTWTRVEDGLPEDDDGRLLITVDGPPDMRRSVENARYVGGRWYWNGLGPDDWELIDSIFRVVAWQAMPEPYRDPEPMPPIG